MPISRDRLRETFIELVRIPSPSLRERGVIDRLRVSCEEMGLACEEDGAGDRLGGNAGNLLVRIPATASGPRVLIAAHADTVEKGDTPIQPRVEGDDIVSDGSTIVGADDVCGCAVMLELARALAEDGVPHGEILLVFSVAEEIEILGVGAMDPTVYADFDVGVVLDHSLPSEVLLGAPTKVAMRIAVHGHGGHGAFPERRINAAHALATAMSRLPSDRLDEHTTANLGILRSGHRINIVPDEAYAEYEIRSQEPDLVDFHVARAKDIIESSVAAFRKHVLGDEIGLGGETAQEPLRAAWVDMEIETCYRGYRHGVDAKPVRFVSRGIRAAGLEPTYRIAQGGSDANVLNARGLPTAVMGCGMHGAHSVGERANLPEMQQSVAVLMESVRAGD